MLAGAMYAASGSVYAGCGSSHTVCADPDPPPPCEGAPGGCNTPVEGPPPGGDPNGNGNSGPGGYDPDAENEHNQMCMSVQGGMAGIGCNLQQRPPALAGNGCGSGVTAGLVPDIYIGAHQLGSMFLLACNNHDICWGTLGNIKEVCDNQIGNDMREACSGYFNPASVIGLGLGPGAVSAIAQHRTLCNIQAQAYEAGLSGNALSLPRAIFDDSQNEASCRRLHDEKETLNCQF